MSKFNFKKAIDTMASSKTEPKLSEEMQKVHEKGKQLLLEDLKCKIEDKNDVIISTIQGTKPYFKKGQDSYVKFVDFFPYHGRSAVDVQMGKNSYKVKVCDIIFKCNVDKDGEKSNSFMDKLTEHTGGVIKFFSCRVRNRETGEPVRGTFMIRAKWTCHRPKEETEGDGSDTSEGDDE
jgi:hypothetical protein